MGAVCVTITRLMHLTHSQTKMAQGAFKTVNKGLSMPFSGDL